MDGVNAELRRFMSCPGEPCEVQSYVASGFARSRVRLRVAAGFERTGGEHCWSVTALQIEQVPTADTIAGDEFEVGYIGEDAVERRVSLSEAWATRFEDGQPVRRFTARKGQKHLSGLWWSPTMVRHVGFESWLERDHLMLLDFDAMVVGIASQPFRLHWRDESGKPLSHTPDYLARAADGAVVVLDCRPVERRPPRDAVKFEATARACAQVGWSYRLVGAVDVIEAANVRWLAGYRHPRHDLPHVAAGLRQVFATPTRLIAGAVAVGDAIAVLPVLFHLLWSHELATDLSVPLGEQSVVRTAGPR
jgi:hypothetical protein